MLKEDIYRTYESMKPDEDAKERMLKNIMSASASQKHFAGRKKKIIKPKLLFRLSAVCACTLIVTTVVYAADLFGLRELGLGKEKIKDFSGMNQEAELSGEDVPMPVEKEVDMISLSGFMDSPEYMACAEWREFLNGYDTDGAILSEIGNNLTGFEEEYEAYVCYTQEMADKIEEICEKYQLSKLGRLKILENYDAICSEPGIGAIGGGMSETVGLNIGGGYMYSDGTFQVEGEAYFTEPSVCMTDYQLRRSMKGSFDTVVLNVGNVEDYTEWRYTTKNGEEVLLANGSTKALIIAENENAFIVVNVLGDIVSGTFEVSNEMLESMADAFLFFNGI